MIVITGFCEEKALAALNGWCAVQERKIEFRPLDTDAAGGGRAMQVDVYAAAGNYYLHRLALAAAFPTFPWEFPDEAVLIAYPKEGPPIIVRGNDVCLEG